MKYEMHGYSNHPLYGVWCDIKARCYNKAHKQYKDYGGRGIIVCNEWKGSFTSFKKWALPLWKKGLEIDRIDNDGNYEPSNCHFVTHTENMHNTRLLRKNNTSGYRGVSYRKRNKKWEAKISINSKTMHLGLFSIPKLAAKAYDNAVFDGRPRNFS